MLIVFGPVLALGALSALLAMGAAKAGWHPDLMHMIASGTGAAVMVLAVALFYLQTGQRRAADTAASTTPTVLAEQKFGRHSTVAG